MVIMRIIHREIVGAFIFTEDKKVLLGKSNRGTYEGYWIIPGGGIDEGESIEKALTREVFEETGINLDVLDVTIEDLKLGLTGESEKVLKGSNERVLGKYNFHNFVVRIKKYSDEIPISGEDDFEQATWHNITELKNLRLPPPSVETFKHLGLL
jgi:8-oxo-dGTP pyrophosphatase MutT (NUDIX family)